MRIFMTGASEFVGSVVIDELLTADHDVTGTVRNEEARGRLADRGAHGVMADMVESGYFEDHAYSNY